MFQEFSRGLACAARAFLGLAGPGSPQILLLPLRCAGPLPKIATLAGAAQVPTIYIKPGNSGLCGQQLPDTVISPPNYYDEGTGAPAATDACSGINLGACSTARPWLSCTSTCTCTEASKPRCDAATGVCRVSCCQREVAS